MDNSRLENDVDERGRKFEALRLVGSLGGDLTAAKKAWDERGCGLLPEPLDAIWLQMALAMPEEAAYGILNNLVWGWQDDSVLSDGPYFGPFFEDDEEVRQIVDHAHMFPLDEELLNSQWAYALHEHAGDDGALRAAWNRIAVCRRFLMAHAHATIDAAATIGEHTPAPFEMKPGLN